MSTESRILIICLFIPVPKESLQGEFQRKLYKELLKNYNPLERPVANDSQPLTVYFTLSLMQIMDVDEKNQVLTTNIWLQMYWTDHYLQWNVSEYPGVKNVRFPDGLIWKPDILLYNREPRCGRRRIRASAGRGTATQTGRSQP
ncbi:PREDICTED: neuronal acetylcholine receptor subunit alpha-7-like [Corvus brachyrhynchos]|uniref:neuronal acetylcholine receptor subunit alpha-7-like n=1 Tax=Corvus brachyrhynchos TaxID=85066 RepID=UPI0008164935|nr:PREDICTED: neuronal acetylcholine receptor subunit alpha-7-like [Corvus brachyrhynchos]